MMKLSRMTDYGIVILSQLAQEETEVSTAADLSAHTGVPAPTVAKLLKLLGLAGLVLSQRGATGGYVLARSPVCISVGEVIAAIDGPVWLTACVTAAGCKVETTCPIHGRWDKVNLAVRRTLDEITLAELIAPVSFVHSLASNAHATV